MNLPIIGFIDHKIVCHQIPIRINIEKTLEAIAYTSVSY
jgi:hypothetical protein